MCSLCRGRAASNGCDAPFVSRSGPFERDHHVQVACRFLAKCKEWLIFDGIVPSVEVAHIRKLDDDDAFGFPMATFGQFMTSNFGYVTPAITGNHGYDLFDIFLVFLWPGNYVLGDVVSRHCVLHLSA